MSSDWTLAQVEALAPDAASVKAATKLGSRAKWPLLAHNADAVWGHCQGSGNKPYQTRIELAEPAFKCSCPSRKFPCKHGLALFRLYVTCRADFATAETPPWVQEWLDGRRARQQKQRQKPRQGPGKSASKTPADPDAQARRAARRGDKIDRGVAELELWLHDLARAGFAELPNKPYRFWDQTRARMIDAQAPGLAVQVERLAEATLSGPGWAGRLSSAAGRLYLLLNAYRRQQALEPGLRAEVRSLVGWPQSKDEVLAGEALHDDWLILSTRLAERDKLLNHQVWLYGSRSRRFGLLLNFAPAAQRATLPLGLRAGAGQRGPLYFYPGATPLRALAGDCRQQPGAALPADAGVDIATALGEFHSALTGNPWLERYPLLLAAVRFGLDGERVWLADRRDDRLWLRHNDIEPWWWLAHSGGRPVTVFGEWDGDSLLPLGLAADGVYHSPDPRKP